MVLPDHELMFSFPLTSTSGSWKHVSLPYSAPVWSSPLGWIEPGEIARPVGRRAREPVFKRQRGQAPLGTRPRLLQLSWPPS